MSFGKSVKKTVEQPRDYRGHYDFDAARAEGHGTIEDGKVTTKSGTTVAVCQKCRHMIGRESVLKGKCKCCGDNHDPKKSILALRSR